VVFYWPKSSFSRPIPDFHRGNGSIAPSIRGVGERRGRAFEPKLAAPSVAAGDGLARPRE